MKISDIITGTKRRRSRDSRKQRITQRDLYTVRGSQLSEADNGARIQHLEDLILWSGSAGAAKAIATLHQVESNPGSVTIKWDGSPAIIFGRNEDGKFVLTDKSGFGAKGYDGRVTSADGLEAMLKNRPGYAKDPSKYGAFAESMKGIWDAVESAVPVNFRGYVHGDLLYFKRPQVKDGKFIFQPNTTTYSVEVKSEVGNKIANSDVGVVVHKAIGLDGSVSDVDMTQFQNGRTLVMPPATMTQSPGVDIPAVDKLDAYLKQNASDIDKFFNIPAEMKMSNLSDLLYNYINSAVKTGKLNSLGNDFAEWVESNNKISAQKKQRLMQWVNDNVNGFNAIFTFIKEIKKIKNQVISSLDNQPADIQASTGGQAGGEGYVVDKDVKLVNRSGFTAANLARER